VEEYERTFSGRRVVFDAAFNGFTFEKDFLSAPMKTADAKLHHVLRAHAELVLSELPRTESLTQRVRDQVAQQLTRGGPSAEEVARELHMSRRTLSRKLLAEGTNFTDLLDDMRRRSALRYVADRELGLSEIAFLLGFSQTGAFHRAFKRWTGQTPLEYRRARSK
jgi:AraC-like DNA-binding protein